MSDELAFSFLNKVKKSLTSSNKKERTAKIDYKEISFLSQQTNTQKNHHRETFIRPFSEEEQTRLCLLSVFVF